MRIALVAGAKPKLVGFAMLLMARALTLTMSRSGMLGLLAALVISRWFVARRQATGSRRAIVAGYLIFVALVAAGWTGFDRIAARFAENGAAEAGGRLGIWGDYLQLHDGRSEDLRYNGAT